MTTIRGIYNNGQVKLLEQVAFTKEQKVLITFLEDDTITEEQSLLRMASLSQPNYFLTTYLNDQQEDLYQDYAKKSSNDLG